MANEWINIANSYKREDDNRALNVAVPRVSMGILCSKRAVQMRA
jgi:hypothetical protein